MKISNKEIEEELMKKAIAELKENQEEERRIFIEELSTAIVRKLRTKPPIRSYVG